MERASTNEYVRFYWKFRSAQRLLLKEAFPLLPTPFPPASSVSVYLHTKDASKIMSICRHVVLAWPREISLKFQEKLGCASPLAKHFAKNS